MTSLQCEQFLKTFSLHFNIFFSRVPVMIKHFIVFTCSVLTAYESGAVWLWDWSNSNVLATFSAPATG
jgi:hypothetical protein